MAPRTKSMDFSRGARPEATAGEGVSRTFSISTWPIVSAARIVSRLPIVVARTSGGGHDADAAKAHRRAAHSRTHSECRARRAARCEACEVDHDEKTGVRRWFSVTSELLETARKSVLDPSDDGVRPLAGSEGCQYSLPPIPPPTSPRSDVVRSSERLTASVGDGLVPPDRKCAGTTSHTQPRVPLLLRPYCDSAGQPCATQGRRSPRAAVIAAT